jgi:hypothetical protein
MRAKQAKATKTVKQNKSDKNMEVDRLQRQEAVRRHDPTDAGSIDEDVVRVGRLELFLSKNGLVDYPKAGTDTLMGMLRQRYVSLNGELTQRFPACDHKNEALLSVIAELPEARENHEKREGLYCAIYRHVNMPAHPQGTVTAMASVIKALAQSRSLVEGDGGTQTSLVISLAVARISVTHVLNKRVGGINDGQTMVQLASVAAALLTAVESTLWEDFVTSNALYAAASALLESMNIRLRARLC